MREENMRLQRKLQREMERREALCRQLSESESSLEMDDERYRHLHLKYNAHITHLMLSRLNFLTHSAPHMPGKYINYGLI